MKSGTAIPGYTSTGHAIRNPPGWINVSRGAALGLALITAFNLTEVLALNTSAVNNWLCDFRVMTQPLCIAILAMLATALLMYSITPTLPGSVWMAASGVTVLVAVFAGWDLWDVVQRVPENLRQTAMSRSLGILMLLAVAGIGILFGNSPAASGNLSILTLGGSCLLTVLGFVIVTLQSGSIGDPVPSDAVSAILVLGCGLSSDGTPSEALTDRVATASKLQIDGHGKRLILSGGPGEGWNSESAAMKELAVKNGIPEAALLPAPGGNSASHAIQFVAGLPELKDDRHIIVVSHWYQLARIRMLGRRAGIQVFAVPAEQQHALADQNRLYAEEVAAFVQACIEPAKKLH